MTVSTEQNTASQPQTPSNDKEYNFAQLRKQVEAERASRIAAEAKAAQLEKAYQDSRRDPAQEEAEDEPYVDHKALKRTLSKFEQNMEQKIEQTAEARARALLEQERQNQFLKANPDFNQIMTPEMIQKFADKHPETAENLLEMPEGFARQKLLYQSIKMSGVNRKEEEKPSIQQTIDQNKRNLYYQPNQLSGGAPPAAMAGDFSAQGQKNAYEKMKHILSNRRAF